MADFAAVFASLKPALAACEKQLAVKSDAPAGYELEGRKPSPFPQHKGQPLYFGAVKTGKAYVSFHLMPVYMAPALYKSISPELKKRMQGKSCFNFSKVPEKEILAELKQLTKACLEDWKAKGWL